MDEAKTEWIAVGMWCLIQWQSDVRMRDGEEDIVTNESIMDEAKTEWIAVGMWCLIQKYSDVGMRDGEEDIIQTYSGSWSQNIQSNKCQENAYDDYR